MSCVIFRNIGKWETTYITVPKHPSKGCSSSSSSPSSLLCIYDHGGQSVAFFKGHIADADQKSASFLSFSGPDQCRSVVGSSSGVFSVGFASSHRLKRHKLGLMAGVSEWRRCSAVTCCHGYPP